MMGHSPIGAAIRASGLFAAAHRPFMLQNVGGAITRCMVRGTTLTRRPFGSGLAVLAWLALCLG